MTIFYLDLECDNLQGTTLLQVACISENFDIFNGFCNPPLNSDLSAHCTELTGFHKSFGKLHHQGRTVESKPRPVILSSFSDWLVKKSEGTTSIIAHNGFGYDYKVLLKHFNHCHIPFPQSVHLCDSLPAIKQFYKAHPGKRPEGDQGYSLGSLAGLYKIENSQVHNGLADAITLKRICDFLIFDHNLPSDFFINKYKTESDISKNATQKDKTVTGGL